MKKNRSMITQAFRENPGVAIRLARGFMGIQKSKMVDYKRKNGISKALPLMTFKITPLCNLKCKMCGQNGVKGTLKSDMKKEADSIVPIERYMELTDEVAGKTKVFYVWGGEPFMYPNFMDLAAYMAKKVLFTVNTNGTFLAENAERIVRDRWAGIFISLDSFKDVNDDIRGKGTFDKVMEGMEALKREKAKQKSELPYVGIVSTVSNLNYQYLDKLAEAMHGRGLAWHIVNLGTYMTDEIGAKHESVFKTCLDVEPKYWQGFNTGFNKNIDGDEFADILERVHKIDNGYPIITVPAIRPDKIGTYYAELEALVQDRCAAPWFSVNINYNGEVNFCADYPDYSIGNIKDNKMWDLYNNERARKFRQSLKAQDHGLFPACRRCYQLMLCGEKCKGY